MNSEVATKSFSKYSRLLKAVLDRLVAAIALAVFSPVILMVAIAIYIRMGSPIVFTQPRPGKNGEVFQFYKFRTSDERSRREGNLLPDLQRITAIGQFLRKTRLDEFPQLGNVIDVSLSTRKTCISFPVASE
jgi:lipopolysaccharide/colanic/teichoic acid biosynthesis glycosyltransferase